MLGSPGLQPMQVSCATNLNLARTDENRVPAGAWAGRGRRRPRRKTRGRAEIPKERRKLSPEPRSKQKRAARPENTKGASLKRRFREFLSAGQCFGATASSESEGRR